MAGVWRHSRWDSVLVALSLVHGALLLMTPSIVLVAIALWWNANTVSHNFLHLPFFRAPRLNRAFAFYLTAVLGFPQSLWRARHLAHHAENDLPPRWTPRMRYECAWLVGVWATAAMLAPQTFVLVYLPGWALGLALCALQGHYEHARGTTSHYGRIYNTAFFNDGYHVEHHASPSRHWTQLRAHGGCDRQPSRWPPVVRWLERVSIVPALLDQLERLVLRSPWLQQRVLARHEAAFRACLPPRRVVRRATIIGGGLFPRTALVLQRLYPGVRITLIDRSAAHLEQARCLLGPSVSITHGLFDASVAPSTDLLVVPLAYVGDREAFYRAPGAPLVLVHDWIWRVRGRGARVSWWMLKRVNLVVGQAEHARLSA